MSRPETDLMSPWERKLIKVPTQLLKVEAVADHTTMEKHLHNNSEGFREILIYTTGGVYSITSCSNCHTVFWDKIQSSEGKANES